MLRELWSEKFEWFGPSPIEPFSQAARGVGFRMVEACQVRVVPGRRNGQVEEVGEVLDLDGPVVLCANQDGPLPVALRAGDLDAL